MAHRLEKIQELLHHEVAGLLQRDFAFAGVLLTVTGAKISSDGQHAAIFFSVFPENERERIAQILEESIFRIQQVINRRMRMRPVPKLRFVPDNSGERVGRIDRILRSVQNGKLPHGKPGPKSRRIRKAA